jgi:hypothetical protein
LEKMRWGCVTGYYQQRQKRMTESIFFLLQLAMQEGETTLTEDDGAALEEINKIFNGCTVVCHRKLSNGRVLCQGGVDRGVSDNATHVLKVGDEREGIRIGGVRAEDVPDETSTVRGGAGDDNSTFLGRHGGTTRPDPMGR